jgi:hypothetical protein
MSQITRDQAVEMIENWRQMPLSVKGVTFHYKDRYMIAAIEMDASSLDSAPSDELNVFIVIKNDDLERGEIARKLRNAASVASSAINAIGQKA